MMFADCLEICDRMPEAADDHVLQLMEAVLRPPERTHRARPPYIYNVHRVPSIRSQDNRVLTVLERHRSALCRAAFKEAKSPFTLGRRRFDLGPKRFDLGPKCQAFLHQLLVEP